MRWNPDLQEWTPSQLRLLWCRSGGALTVIQGNGAPPVAALLLAAMAMLTGPTTTPIADLVPLRPTIGRPLGLLGCPE